MLRDLSLFSYWTPPARLLGQRPPEREVCVRAKEENGGEHWRGLVPRYLTCSAL